MAEEVKNVKEPESFEEAMTELQDLVNQLEKGEMALDKALSAFERGIELSRYCEKTLTEAEEAVTKLMTQEGEVPFDKEEA